MKRLPLGAFPREIYALFFVRLVVSAGSFVNPFLAMLLTMKLGYDEASAGVFMSAVSAVSAAGILLGGRLGDVRGRKVVLATLQLVTACAYAVCAVAGFKAFTPFVIALALGALSGTWPVINAIVADAAPPERGKEAFALLYWGCNIGFSAGSLAAGFLFTRAPRFLFVGNSAALVAAAAIVLVFVRETNPLERGTLATGSGRAEPVRPRLPIVGSREGDSLASSGDLGLPSVRESTLRVLSRDPTLAVFALLSILVAFVYNQHLFALPVFLKDLLGQDSGPRTFGAAMAVNGLTVVVCTALVTAASRRLPALAAVASGLGLYALGFGSYALASGAPMVLASTFVWSVGEILCSTNINVFVAGRAPASHRSRVNGAVSFCTYVGNTVAPLVAGPAMKTLGSRALWAPVGLLAALGALGFLVLHGSDRACGPRPSLPQACRRDRAGLQ